MMQVIVWDKAGSKKLGRKLEFDVDKDLFRKVNKILSEVKSRGDNALRRFTREFDGIELQQKRLRVTEGDINRAFEKISIELVPLIKKVSENIKSYYAKELRSSFKLDKNNGIMLGKNYNPFRRVGVYIPGGTAPLVSTVYMTVIPAQIAGVEEIVMCSPPNRDTGEIDPHILAVANLLGVKEIYRVGGAQAIGGMAFGTKTIKKVDKIAGPGNQYVTEAKRQVYGYCDIDMIAGPSEVCIIADQGANPDFITCDLLSQTEHFCGSAYLVTNSKKIVDTLRRRIDHGTIIMVKNLNVACEVVNEIAPEHLEIMTKSPQKLLKKIKNAGAIFLGEYTPTVVGDYIAGPSHVLPTGGTARYFSPLGAMSFVKNSQIISYSKDALAKTSEDIKKIADVENMILHRLSLEARFASGEKSKEEKK